MRILSYLTAVTLFSLLYSTKSAACTASSIYPANTTVTDSSSLNPLTITTCNYAGEYAVVVLSGNFNYTFESSVATDFLTITNTSNTTIDTGSGSVTINSAGIDTVRMHIFLDTACAQQTTCRVTTVTRAPCLATIQFPAYVDTANNNYDTHFVSACSYPGQFYEIVLFPGRYEFASSNSSDFFVFTDSANNLLAYGQTPFLGTVTAANYLKVRVHIFASLYCDVEAACRTTTVRRLPCVATNQSPGYSVQAPYHPALDTIWQCNYAGQYVRMDINAGETYEISSDSADWFFLTLTDDTYISSGQTPFTFTNPYGDTTIRAHIFQDSSCREQDTCRQTYVQCLTCPVPIPSISSSDSVACTDDLPITLTNDNPFVGKTYWYTSTCGSTPIDSGTTIQVSPSTATTYYCANSYESLLSPCDSITLEVFPSPSVSIGNVMDVLCFGGSDGSAQATGSSGLSPYSYLWSTGEDSNYAIQLNAGQLSLLLTDVNGCFAYDTVYVIQPEAIADSVFNQYNPLCFGDETGQLGILISGGVAPYAYNWSNSETTANITDLGQGTYSLTLTDENSCEEVYSYDIISPAELDNEMGITDVWCKGGSTGAIQTDVTGGVSSYDYNWSSGDTNGQLFNLDEGVYVLSLTDQNGCAFLDTVTISYTHANPEILMDTAAIICVNQTTTLDAGAGFVYAWSTNQSTQTIEISIPGTYKVTITDSRGCSSSQGVIVTTDSCLGISPIIKTPDYRIYPNPSNGSIQFEIINKDISLDYIQLESITGQSIKKISLSGFEAGTLDFLDVAKGVYIMNFVFDQGVQSQQIIIQ